MKIRTNCPICNSTYRYEDSFGIQETCGKRKCKESNERAKKKNKKNVNYDLKKQEPSHTEVQESSGN